MFYRNSDTKEITEVHRERKELDILTLITANFTSTFYVVGSALYCFLVFWEKERKQKSRSHMTLRAKCEVQAGNQKPSLPTAVFSSNSSVNIRFTENHIPESSVCKKNTDLVVRVLGVQSVHPLFRYTTEANYFTYVSHCPHVRHG